MNLTMCCRRPWRHFRDVSASDGDDCARGWFLGVPLFSSTRVFHCFCAPQITAGPAVPEGDVLDGVGTPHVMECQTLSRPPVGPTIDAHNVLPCRLSCGAGSFEGDLTWLAASDKTTDNWAQHGVQAVFLLQRKHCPFVFEDRVIRASLDQDVSFHGQPKFSTQDPALHPRGPAKEVEEGFSCFDVDVCVTGKSFPPRGSGKEWFPQLERRTCSRVTHWWEEATLTCCVRCRIHSFTKK